MSELEINSEQVTEAEIIVAIPSYNEVGNIAFPTAKASDGLVQYFGHLKSAIINCDNHSSDGTREAFLATPTEVPKIYLSTPPGLLGKGHNLRNLFAKATELGAKAVVVVDADLLSITPQWIKHLGEPLFNDFGFVAPLYVRHKYDGTITNSIAYPLTRALYGRRVRQPIGGDFGFSSRMLEIFRQDDTWNDDIANFGIDIWMTTLAMNHGVPICQAFMGRPKLHRHKNSGAGIPPLFKQVVGTILDLMVAHSSVWSRIKWSRPTAIYGFGLGEIELPPPVNMDLRRLHDRFIEGFQGQEAIWRAALTPEIREKIEELGTLTLERFDFPTTLWVKVLYDLAVTYGKTEPAGREAVIGALMPFYFAKTLSFVKKTERMSIQQAEEFIEHEAVIFEEIKPYLLERWPH